LNDSHHLPPAANRLAHWILFAAACNIAGWALSLLHAAHLPGFLIAIPLAWYSLAKLSGLDRPPGLRTASFHGWKRRAIKWLPAGFLIVAMLALLGGLLHAPNNLDAMNYRMPKVAHWLMAERWEWIPANNNSLNTRSSGFEWLTAPMIALFRTDRFVFIYNYGSFLFLPGLVFSLFRQMGVGSRAAWSWMWVVPAGYCFALQAGSISNDLPAAVFAAAAFDFGFRWKRTRNRTSFAIALAACGMMTAIKPTTLPLLLPFAVLFFGMWKTTLAAPARTATLAVLFGLASFLPTAALNIRHCGDWTGAAAENKALGQVRPLIGLAGNSINLPIQNLAPPIFPLAGKWNENVVQWFPEPFLAAMKRDFEINGAKFFLPDFQNEESAGIGAGLTYLLLFSWLLGLVYRQRSGIHAKRRRRPLSLYLGLLFGAALLAYFSRAGMSTVARHVTPYYIFFIAVALRTICQEQVVQRKVWNLAAIAAIGSAIVLMIITPSRPLWPAQWVFNRFVDDNSSPFMKRAKSGYTVYGNRSDCLGVMRDALPATAAYVGFMSYNTGPELSLWKPYLKRKVRHVRPSDEISLLQREGMTHVILNVKNFENILSISPEQWLKDHSGKILKREHVQILVKEEASEWWTVELPKQ
jgi:hypothetical protein